MPSYKVRLQLLYVKRKTILTLLHCFIERLLFNTLFSCSSSSSSSSSFSLARSRLPLRRGGALTLVIFITVAVAPLPSSFFSPSRRLPHSRHFHHRRCGLVGGALLPSLTFNSFCLTLSLSCRQDGGGEPTIAVPSPPFEKGV